MDVGPLEFLCNHCRKYDVLHPVLGIGSKALDYSTLTGYLIPERVHGRYLKAEVLSIV